MTMTVVSIAISVWNGREGFEKKFRDRIETIQTKTLLRLARILRRVLET